MADLRGDVNYDAMVMLIDWGLTALSAQYGYIASLKLYFSSEPAHLVAHQRTQHSIVVRPTAVRAISTDIICQTIVQHCRTSDFELTATCRIKLRLSLYFQIKT